MMFYKNQERLEELAPPHVRRLLHVVRVYHELSNHVHHLGLAGRACRAYLRET